MSMSFIISSMSILLVLRLTEDELDRIKKQHEEERAKYIEEFLDRDLIQPPTSRKQQQQQQQQQNGALEERIDA